MSSQISFRDDVVEKHLEKRAAPNQSLSLVAKRDLDRYYYLITGTKLDFTADEWAVIVNALKGQDFSHPSLTRDLASKVLDAIENAPKGTKVLLQHYQDQMIRTINNLTEIETLALIDKVEMAQIKAAPLPTAEKRRR